MTNFDVLDIATQVADEKSNGEILVQSWTVTDTDNIDEIAKFLLKRGEEKYGGEVPIGPTTTKREARIMMESMINTVLESANE